MLGRKATLHLILIFYAFVLTACFETTSSTTTTGEDRQPSAVDPASECVAGEVRVKNSNGEFQTFSQIQEAINASSNGSSIYVGPGSWNEILNVNGKKNLVIQSNCKSQIKGVKVASTTELTIRGFIIDAKNSNSDGIRVDGDTSYIRIEENYIHSSALNGIRFDAHETDVEVSGPIKAGPHFVTKNVIHGNAQNGIVVFGKQLINLDSNRIIGNGTGADQKDGYGLKIANAENEEYIKLTNNIIAYNDGKVSPNKSTKDLYGIKKILDAGDSGNLTTAGTEGTGVGQFVDTKLPVIKISVEDPIYTSNPAFTISVTIDDEAPTTTKVFQNGLLISTQKNFVFDVNATLKDGNNTFKFESTDAVGNKTTANLNQIVLDRVLPIIKINTAGPILTNQPSFNISVSITDSSPTTTRLYKNGSFVADSTEKNVNFNVTLEEGANAYVVTCIDAAGNQAESKTIDGITLDSIAPVLSGLTPANDSVITTLNFLTSGQSNEVLSVVTLNGANVNLSSDKKSFQANYSVTHDGPVTFTWQAIDLAGNSSYTAITFLVSTQVLYGNLITVEPTSSPGRLTIRGMAGAAKPGIEVTAKAGFLFNGGSAISANDGSFSIELDFFQTATVSAFNSTSGATESVEVEFQPNTQLSGIIKDINNLPLSGVTIRIEKSSVQTLTDGNGSFALSNMAVTGDQMLVIDGTTVPDTITGPQRKFSITKLLINIGIGQNNVLSRPVFLAPIMLDGTETQVTSSGGTVMSPRAPGVELQIPPNSALFPNGSSSGVINMNIVDAQFSTIPVPEFAIPTQVISLEPSGMTFKEPVQLVLPNDNNLPEGVEMVILSLNSQKGIWEIDGSAKVQGNSVVTKPGLGISHFSEVYAVPIGPILRHVNNPERIGADTFNGALATSISLPSFKSLGREIAPSLTYRSSWAKPTAVISNFIDIPKQEVTFERKIVGTRTFFAQSGHKSCDFFSCWIEYRDYYYFSTFDLNRTITSWYEPESIGGKFYFGGIAGQLSTVSNPSASAEFKGSPNKAVISYALELKDPKTDEYLPTGVYSGATRYEIRLRNLTMVTTKGTRFSTGIRIPAKGAEIVDEKGEVETRVLDQVFPHDIGVNVYVQNEVNSPAGQGWKVNGVQKIVNPSSRFIMIEQEDGSIASYAIDDTISTLYDASNTSVDLSQGVDITNWPNAKVTSFDSSQVQTQVMSVDLASGNQATVGNLTNYTGELYDHEPYYSERFVPFLFGTAREVKWRRNLHPFQVRSKTTQLLTFPDGTVFGTDDFTHRLFSLSQGSFNGLAGVRAYPVYMTDYGPSYEGVLNYCNQVFGTDCSARTTTECLILEFPPGSGHHLQTIGCGGITYHYYPHLLPQVGGGGAVFNGDGAASGVGLNTPMGIVNSPDAHIVFADSGNNMVRKYDRNTGIITTIVGNGQSFDSGDGGHVLDASLFHPRGVTYDALGNLYISTERGYIRKVTPDGTISTVAGLPLELGGTIAHESFALQTAMSRPYGMVFDNANNLLYIADTGNHRVLQLDFVTNSIKSVAGSNTCSAEIGNNSVPALSASLCSPTHLGLDENRNLIIVDSGHNKIKRVHFQNSTGQEVAFSPINGDLSKLSKNTDGAWVRTYRKGVKIFFDAQGRQTATLDRIGNQATYSYDPQGHLLSITDPVGQEIHYNYSGNQLVSITDPVGRTTNFNYTGSRLTTVVFPNGAARSYEYSSDGLMSSEKNELGFATQYTYNQWNRLQSVVRPDGTQVVINDSTSSTIGNNYSPGQEGQLKSYGLGQGQLFDGIVDAKSIQTKFVKDLDGFITEIQDGEDQLTLVQRNDRGKPTLIKRPDGTEVIFIYDPATQDLLSTKDISSNVITSAAYDVFGNILTKTDGRGNTTTNTLDANTGVLLLTSGPLEASTAYTYGSHGLVNSVTKSVDASSSKTTTYSYDSLGRLVSTSDPSGRQTVTEYDTAGNVIKIFNRKDGVIASTYQYSYDHFNRILSATTSDGTTTIYTYLPTGKLASIKDQKGNVTTFAYDKLGRVLSKIDPLGFSTSFTYDGNSNVIQRIDPNGNVANFSYDNLNRQTQAQLSDDVYQYAYDVRSNRTLARNSVSELRFTFDPRGNAISAQSLGLGSLADLPSSTINYTYDANNNRLTMGATHGGVQNYTYDALNRLTSVKNHKNEIYSFAYDFSNRLKIITRPGSSTSLDFDSSDFLIGIIHSNSTTTLSSVAYQFDVAGNRTVASTSSGAHSYGYDVNNQLTSAQHPNLGYPTLPQENFSYDSIGNRTTDQLGNYTYDQFSQRLSEDYKYTYLYDKNGNLLFKMPKNATEEAFAFSYSSLNQLIATRIYNGVVGLGTFGPIKKEIFYSYDAIGRRIQKKITDHVDAQKSFTRKYVYDGQEILAEYNSDNLLLARYTHSNLRLDDVLAADITTNGVTAGLAQNPGTITYLKDALGSIASVANTAGQILQNYNYSSFGRIVSITDQNNQEITQNPVVRTSYTFSGREQDEESGLYYYRARYYDPNIGRFLQEDPEPGKINMPISIVNKFVYAANNPVLYTDPTGKIFGIDDLLFAVIIGTISAFYAASNESDMSKKFSAFVQGFVFGTLFAGTVIAANYGIAEGIHLVAGLSMDTSLVIAQVASIPIFYDVTQQSTNFKEMNAFEFYSLAGLGILYVTDTPYFINDEEHYVRFFQ